MPTSSRQPDDDVSNPELAQEQRHLAASRRALARMRERAASLDSSAAGDWVSRQVLESVRYRRLKALEEDPSAPLFFGRLDYSDDHPAAHGENYYIGRRHVTDEVGDPMVIDWRAPISLPFYRASRTEPMGVERRRRFGFKAGVMTAYEDELLVGGAFSGGWSRILEEEIERPRFGPMRDVVATVQPDQDVIVRAPLSESICVQGAPGTGKTAVGLHRAAFLLYNHRDQLSRRGVLVIGPNASFLHYIGDVLPALGEIDVQHATIEQLVTTTLTGLNARYAIRGTDTVTVSTLKGDARMAEVIARAAWSQVRSPTEPLIVARGAARWRVPSYEIEEILTSQRERGIRYGTARAQLAQRFARAVLVKMEQAGHVTDDRVQDALASTRAVKQYVDAVWPAVDPARLVHRLLADPQALADAADGILDREEQATLLWDKPSRAATSARWSLADAVLVDEAADLLERTPSLGHVVADEAQDLSPMMLRAVGRRCTTGSMTVLGDLAQGTAPWAIGNWAEALGHLGKTAHLEELTEGFRVPAAVIEYASRLLPWIAPELTPPRSVRLSRGDLVIRPDLDVVETLRSERVGSVGVIVPDSMLAQVTTVLETGALPFELLGDADSELGSQAQVVPASLAKGLEFDHVVLVEPATIVDDEPDRRTGLRRLYVCLTRAVSSLVVHHRQALPEELTAPRPWPLKSASVGGDPLADATG